MRTLLVITLAALALVAVPHEAAPVGTAAAVVCDVDDVECHVNRAKHCIVNLDDPTDPPVCTA